MTAMKDGENHPPILTPYKEKERAMSHWDRVTFPMLYSQSELAPEGQALAHAQIYMVHPHCVQYK